VQDHGKQAGDKRKDQDEAQDAGFAAVNGMNNSRRNNMTMTHRNLRYLTLAKRPAFRYILGHFALFVNVFIEKKAR
jgi:hypothetical protein